MENKARVADKALIQVILQEYRDRSVDSITGPAAIRKYEPATGRHRVWPPLAEVGALKPKRGDYVSSSKELDSQPFSPPRLLAPSGVAAARRKPSKVKRTLLDGIPIACFNIGGEKRLCFDQLIAEVLKEFPANEVNNSRDHLKIYCPKCDEDQLESLKLSKAVPWSDSSCLLISKSDAYRLCSALLASRAPQRHDKSYTKPFLDVYHECFGGCEGIFEPEVYVEPHAKCVTCLECYRMFSPRKFVTHSHSTTEIQTCHWGMDSSKWRDYLLLPDEKADNEMTKKLWEDVKKRFFGTIRKRKLSNSEAESVAESECSETSAKKRNVLTYAVSPSERPSGTPTSSVSSPREHSDASRRSAFRPWSPLEDKSRIESSSDGQPCKNVSPNRFIQPAPHVIQPPSHAIPPPSHPIQPAYLARNCSCSPYASMSGYVQHSTPIKSEYSSVICSQSLAQRPRSQDGLRGDGRPRENASHETTVQDFASPERVKQVLSKYCHRGHLPSVDELSFALAKELQEWSYGQSRVLNEVKEKGEKLREEMNTLRRENTTKLDAACEELKCCQENLDQLNRKRDEDIKEFAKTREALQRQVESLHEQRSSESETVKKLMSQLNERDTRCRLLEKELDYIRSWYVDSQRRYPPFQTLPVAVYGGANLRDMYCNQSAVIQEIPMFSRNGESPSLNNRGKSDEPSEREECQNDENDSKGDKEKNE